MFNGSATAMAEKASDLDRRLKRTRDGELKTVCFVLGSPLLASLGAFSWKEIVHTFVWMTEYAFPPSNRGRTLVMAILAGIRTPFSGVACMLDLQSF